MSENTPEKIPEIPEKPAEITPQQDASPPSLAAIPPLSPVDVVPVKSWRLRDVAVTVLTVSSSVTAGLTCLLVVVGIFAQPSSGTTQAVRLKWEEQRRELQEAIKQYDEHEAEKQANSPVIGAVDEKLNRKN